VGADGIAKATPVSTGAKEAAVSKKKLWYKPVSLIISVSAGALASVLFKRAWMLVGHDEDAPDATDEERDWTEVLTAAALHGVIFAVVKAALDRAGAAGVRRLTGTWPAG
jgi:Protein of unknown function (DUF4235)